MRKPSPTSVRYCWGIVLGGTGLLGSGWWGETTPSIVFSTRKEAQAEAKRLTDKYAARPDQAWKFWAVKVRVVVEGCSR